MALALDALLPDLDPDQALKDVLAVGAAVGLNTTAWEPGDVAYDLTDTVTTWFCDQWNRWIAPGIRTQFLPYASGAWLTYKAWADYNRPRQDATFAVGDIVIENRGSGVGTIAAGTLRVKNAAGKTFTNTTTDFMPIWTGSGGYPTLTLTFQADEAGSASNTGINALPTYPTPPTAAPFGSLYVKTNAALLGADAEGDDLLRKRCQLAAAERGLTPRQLVEAVALDPIGAMRRAGLTIPTTWPPTVNVTRVRVDEPGGGVVAVYLASPSGAAAGNISTPDSDVYICNTALQLLAAPIGGSLTCAAATEVPINYGTIGIYVKREANVAKSVAEATATAALTALFQGLPIGGERKISGSNGYALIQHVYSTAGAGAGVFNVTSSVVNYDVTLTVSQVAVPSYTVSALIVTQGT